MSSVGKTFFGNVPTIPDVNLLCSAFDNAEPGKLIRYVDIENVISVGRGTSRFSTIVNAWRKKLEREQNVILVSVRGEGLKVADPTARVDLAGREVKAGVKKITKAASIASSTDRSQLTESQKRVCDHLSRAASSISLASLVAKKLEPPKE